MASMISAYRGCLLGLAVGDAMGYTVDKRSLQEIQRDYGPNGLRGYDLVNGYADVTSYTQIAAFTCNGLLIGMTRSRLKGSKVPLNRYIELGLREWAACQRPWGRPDRSSCWLLRRKDMCRRHCMDTRMLDILSRPQEPETARYNHFSGPGSITAAIGTGLFFGPRKADPEKVDRLGGEAVAIVFGNPDDRLAGEVLTHIICALAQEPDRALKGLVQEAMDLIQQRYAHSYSHTYDVVNVIRDAVTLAELPGIWPPDAMEKLECRTAPQVLAGAVYACLASGGDFDRTMILSVNHSGRSAAVGAIAGAIAGLRLGEKALPNFYIESLEPAQTLRELAVDVFNGCPTNVGLKILNPDWDYKYLQGGQ